MEKFDNLRNKYKEFIYKSYKISEDESKIKIEYCFEIPNLAVFKPSIEIKKDNISFKNTNNDYVKNLVFNIGMVELISYWKCACPKKVIIKCGTLDSTQIEWFKKLYYYGLGEYRYINNIQIDIKDMLDIIVDTNYKLDISNHENDNLNGILIPIGGGKDSCVTAELLNKNRDENLCLIVGRKNTSHRICRNSRI